MYCNLRNDESMRRTVYTLVVALLCFTAIGLAQDDLESWMKAASAGMGGLKKSLDAKNNADAAQMALKLEGVFESVGKYCTGKSEDAAKFAQSAKSAAKEIAAAAEAGNIDGVNTGFGKLGASCKGCHDAHREKVDGGFRFKP